MKTPNGKYIYTNIGYYWVNKNWPKLPLGIYEVLDNK